MWSRVTDLVDPQRRMNDAPAVSTGTMRIRHWEAAVWALEIQLCLKFDADAPANLEKARERY